MSKKWGNIPTFRPYSSHRTMNFDRASPFRFISMSSRKNATACSVFPYQTQIRAKEQAGRQHRSERHDLRYKFWADLLSLAKTKTDLHANRKPGVYGWIGGGIGKAGLSLNYATREDDSQVELYIDFGLGSDDKNLQILKEFQQHQEEIEAAFGGQLEWQDLPDSRGCRVRKIIDGGWRTSQDEWPKIHANLVEAMIKLDGALRPYVQKLKV